MFHFSSCDNLLPPLPSIWTWYYCSFLQLHNRAGQEPLNIRVEIIFVSSQRSVIRRNQAINCHHRPLGMINSDAETTNSFNVYWALWECHTRLFDQNTSTIYGLLSLWDRKGRIKLRKLLIIAQCNECSFSCSEAFLFLPETWLGDWSSGTNNNYNYET